jgi:hypothetical protein
MEAMRMYRGQEKVEEAIMSLLGLEQRGEERFS